MKKLLFIFVLILSGCATAELSINRDIIKSHNKVLIIPFSSDESRGNGIYSEAEEKFRAALISLDYRVIDKEKAELLLKKDEFRRSEDKPENIKKICRLLDADAVLTGKVIEDKEIQRDIRQHGSFVSGLNLFNRDNDRIDNVKRTTFYRFKIFVKLTDMSDGSVIFTVTNRYVEAEHDEYLPGYASLGSYRRLVLDKIIREFIPEMKKQK